ncbi:hypothetical protein QFC21_001423 [Naganishia friedmannii]|uniref:Uncharacterized protein n=1 Tax=Naganishia friedmannii TaxID=89922 RepID=A0ACC2W4F9_9TREE|nr:hypothetical protein QFC21_001423 [Naganishia friedmannii]
MADDESDFDDDSEYSNSEDEVMDDEDIDNENANDGEQVKEDEEDEDEEGAKDPRAKRMKLALCLPYQVETLEQMDAKLDYIITKLTVAIEAQDWEYGFRSWLGGLNNWMSLGYPMQKEIRLKLILTLYDIAILPGFGPGPAAQTTEMVRSLLRLKPTLNINDLRLDWKPLYHAVSRTLSLYQKKRYMGQTTLVDWFLGLAYACRRFFHPSQIEDMLETILPRLDGTNMSAFTQSLTQDPLTTVAALTVLHLNPKISDPQRVVKIPTTPLNPPKKESHVETSDLPTEHISNGDGKKSQVDAMDVDDDLPALRQDGSTESQWKGLRKDIGILTEKQFQTIVAKCISTLGSPVGGDLAMVAGAATPADSAADPRTKEINRKTDVLADFATIIVYSMAEDAEALESTESPVASPGNGTPMPAALSRLKAKSTNASTDSLLEAGKNAELSRKSLGGSKALHYLHNFLQASEIHFHPSRHSQHSLVLCDFIKVLASQFLRRWKQEETRGKNIPKEWRLTPRIKREFVALLSNLAMMSMFSGNAKAIGSSKDCLKSLGFLEPQLIVTPMLERIVPALQGEFVETNRAMAGLQVISAILSSLVRPDVPIISGEHPLLGLMEVLLEYVDTISAEKTSLAAATLMGIINQIKLEALPEEVPEGIAEGKRAPPSTSKKSVSESDKVAQAFVPVEETERSLRIATASFPQWTADLVAKMFKLYSAMLEISSTGDRNGRGITKDERLASFATYTMDTVAVNLSPAALEPIVQQVYDNTMGHIEASALRIVPGLIGTVAREGLAFEKFFPTASSRLRSELQNGSFSIRTNTSSSPRETDVPALWYLGAIYGSISKLGDKCTLCWFQLTSEQDNMIDLFKLLVDKCYAETGWTWTGQVIEKVLMSLTATRPREARLVNPDEWKSEGKKTELISAMPTLILSLLGLSLDFKYNAHMYFGKRYKFDDVKVEWQVPGDEEIAMVFKVIEEVLVPAADKIEALLDSPTLDDVWINDMCRFLFLVKSSLSGLAAGFWLEDQTRKTGGKEVELCEPPRADYMRDFEQYASMFALTDPSDVRYQRYQAYRERLGGLFHRISGLAIDKDVSNPDLIRWLCSAIGSYVNMYNSVEKSWSDNNKNHATMVALGRQWYGQKELPRHYSIKRMEVYHLTRCHLVTMTRARDNIDDQLINDLVAFTISPYVKIRKTSQSYMKHVLASFRGVKALVLPQYLDKLRSDIDPDVVKGALYSLNQLLPFAIDRPEYLEELFIKLLDLEKQPKPSIQKLTAKILSEAIATTPSPVTLLQPTVAIDDIRRFRFTDLTADIDKKLPAEVSAKLVELRSKREQAYQSLISSLLQRAPTVHWRYKTYIASVLLQLLVRELPVTAEHAKFFIDLVGDPHPALARCGLQAVTRILYIAKLRHLCNSEQELLLQRYTKHPLKREQSLTNIPSDYTRQYIASLKSASINDTDLWLEDDDITGWLCWNNTVTQRRLPGEGEVVFDFQGDAKVTIDAMRDSIEDPDFWQTVVGLWSQEKTRTQLSSSIIEFVRAVSQAYGSALLDPLSEIMIDLIEGEKDEQRAFAEILTGITRSAFVYWPKKDRERLWQWLIPTLDVIFKNMKQDSIDSWLDFWERSFDRRDIRRIRPLLDWIFDKAKNADYVNGSAFELEKISSFLSSMIGTGGWRYDAWSDELIEMTFREDIILNPYQEIRRYVADNFLNIENIRWHPSYPSAKAFLEDCRSNPEKDVIGSHSTMTEHVKRLLARLPEWRKERVPGPSAPQSTYDKAASTILRFGYGLNELHASSVFDWAVPDLLQELIEIREFKDNPTLSNIATVIAVTLSAITPPDGAAQQMIDTILGVLKTTTSWRIRLHTLPLLAVLHYRQLPLLGESSNTLIMDALFSCLDDDNLEVRQSACSALCGVLQCSMRSSIKVLKERFLRQLKASKIPKARDTSGNVTPQYNRAVINTHGAVLGLIAIIQAHPYTVPSYVPDLWDVLAKHSSDPAPIGPDIRKCAAAFRQTHTDSWHEDKLKFTEDQLSNLSYVISGTSYYA